MKVGLTARLTSGQPGGVEQVLVGLASGLSGLQTKDEEFYFSTIGGEDDWLRPHIAGACKIAATPQPAPSSGLREFLKRTIPSSRRLARVLPPLPGMKMLRPPASDGSLEALGVDVVHFVTQDAFATDLPSIYQPHDLLHVHLPHLLTPRQREFRGASYPLHCERAQFVVTMTTWGKNDLVRHFGLPPERIRVIPWAPVLSAYERPHPHELAETITKFDLPEDFLLYPAQTWPHKNHVRLLESLAILRDRHGLRIPLVCSGTQNDFFPHITRRVAELRLDDQVRFLGFVTTKEIQCLYSEAKALIFPSLFEGWGMPICEAFASDLPVASSKATSLPDLVGDAGLLFDPSDPEEMADAVASLWCDDDLRNELMRRGRRRAADFSWEATARSMRALYRETSGKALSAEDEKIRVTPNLV